MTGRPLLSVRGLGVSIRDAGGSDRPILSDISFDLQAGDTLGIVGESGSGKTLLALSILALLPEAARAGGSIELDGVDMVRAPERDRQVIRGTGIAMIFQEPATALDPAMRVGDQIAEGPRLRGASRAEARALALALLRRVRIADAEARIDAFPHELSGGQRQRVAIAVALAGEPRLLLADEPTTALDATIRGEILDLLAELARDASMALILVSHDIAAIRRVCRRALVLYAGARFEEGLSADILGRPANPYTRALLAARPRPRLDGPGGVRTRLAAIPGTVPRFSALPPGCRFAPRCAFRVADCEAGEPGWRVLDDGRGVRCIRIGVNGCIS